MQKLLVRWLWNGGMGLGVAVFALYATLAPPYITDGDNGEFASLSATGGVAHPSGYPLYVLWLRATSWLPGQNTVHTAAISTSILGAALVVLLHAACRAWGARTAAATASSLAFAIGPIVLKNHIKAEVFALNGVVVATVLWLAAAAGPLRGAWRTFALGLVAGLGIANHLTCVLVAPVGLLGAVRGVREARTRAPAIALGVAGLVVGLSPYLYLFIAPSTMSSWGSVHDFADLMHVFLRQDYGGPGAFAGTERGVDITANLMALGHASARGCLWVLVPVALVGWTRRLVGKERSPEAEPRAGWIALAVAWLIAGPLLVMRFNIEPVGFGLAVCERFYLLPLLLLVIPVAIGLDDVFEIVARRVPVRATPLFAVLGAFTALFAATLSIRQVARVHSPAVEQYTLNLLGTLPQDAVLITSDDATYATIHYFQQQRGIRTDIVQVQWSMLTLSWYKERIARQGVFSLPGPKYPSQQLALGVLATGRPLFVDLAQTRVLELFSGYPHGIVIRIIPPNQKGPPIDEIVALNRQLYDHFEFPYDLPGRDDDLITALHERYASPWNTIGRKLESLGRKADAEEAFARARAIAPQD